MKPEYTDGPKALENFERLATAVMQANIKGEAERINLTLPRGNQNLSTRTRRDFRFPRPCFRQYRANQYSCRQFTLDLTYPLS
jgi:hypothetical protein